MCGVDSYAKNMLLLDTEITVTLKLFGISLALSSNQNTYFLLLIYHYPEPWMFIHISQY